MGTRYIIPNYKEKTEKYINYQKITEKDISDDLGPYRSDVELDRMLSREPAVFSQHRLAVERVKAYMDQLAVQLDKLRATDPTTVVRRYTHNDYPEVYHGIEVFSLCGMLEARLTCLESPRYLNDFTKYFLTRHGDDPALRQAALDFALHNGYSPFDTDTFTEISGIYEPVDTRVPSTNFVEQVSDYVSRALYGHGSERPNLNLGLVQMSDIYRRTTGKNLEQLAEALGMPDADAVQFLSDRLVAALMSEVQRSPNAARLAIQRLREIR